VPEDEEEVAPTSPPASVLTADGRTYALGAVASFETIFSVKQRLSTLSDMDENDQSIYLIDDTRGDEEAIELLNDDTVGNVMRLSSSSTELRFAVLVGMKDDNAGRLVMGLAPSLVAPVTVGGKAARLDDDENEEEFEQLYDPRGVAFVPSHPHLLLTTAYGSNQVLLSHTHRASTTPHRIPLSRPDLPGLHLRPAGRR
jgi:hypothetical protein